jgi:hypothetical protein
MILTCVIIVDVIGGISIIISVIGGISSASVYGPKHLVLDEDDVTRL